MVGDLVKVYECDEFVLYSTGRDYDFGYCIDNKTNDKFTLYIDCYDEYEGDVIEVNDWIGLFAGSRNDMNAELIKKGQYYIERD